uniref:Uncharacterized protein n=1 Tax=Rhizophora mucronata TaxID=61149 RepID=A0A2P2PUD9_RHIMU
MHNIQNCVKNFRRAISTPEIFTRFGLLINYIP